MISSAQHSREGGRPREKVFALTGAVLSSAQHSSSVADPGCLARIPDPTITKEEGGNICCLTFFVATEGGKVGVKAALL